jgi:hypothetical protein
MPAAQRPALPAAGENQLTKRETFIVQKQLQKRAESQPSGARFVGQTRLVQDSLPEREPHRQFD